MSPHRRWYDSPDDNYPAWLDNAMAGACLLATIVVLVLLPYWFGGPQ
jgi:hypothetical protein